MDKPDVFANIEYLFEWIKNKTATNWNALNKKIIAHQIELMFNFEALKSIQFDKM